MTTTNATIDRPKTWNENRRGKVTVYTYTKLKELESNVGSKDCFNVYGVVMDSRPTRMSKGRDYFKVLRITDDTYEDQDGIKVTLFLPLEKDLPDVNVLDIIRLHRMRIDIYMGNITLVGGKGWSWVTWTSKRDEQIDNGKSAAVSWTVLDSDKKLVKDLKKWVSIQSWSLDSLGKTATMGGSRRLIEARPGTYFDWSCQIVGIARINVDTIVFKAWDGTLPSHQIHKAQVNQDTTFTFMPNMPLIDEYIVDVAVYDNHVDTVQTLDIQPGMFVRFVNLHASKKAGNADSEAEGSSELFLHGGLAFNRGLMCLGTDSDDLTELKRSLKDAIEARSASINLSLEEPKKRILSPDASTSAALAKKQKFSSPSPSSATSDDVFRTPPQLSQGELVDRSPMPSGSVVELVAQQPNSVQSAQGTVDTLGMLADMEVATNGDPDPAASQDSQEVATQESGEALRCHQDSRTVVFGDGSPITLSSIRDVIDAEVPARTSKLFRIRARIRKCSDPSRLVYHYCPATGLRVVAKNDGSNLTLDDSVQQWLTKWRESCGLDQYDQPSDDDKESIINQSFASLEEEECNTQWKLPSVNVVMATHEHPDDGSHWQAMVVGKDLVRKRKTEREKFTIFYDSDGTESFATLSRDYNRVVRVITRAQLTSSSLPPVAFQGGIHYYCSPGCVRTVAIPSLSEEAATFVPGKPLQALSCPLLLLHYYVTFTFADDDSTELEACVKGSSAVEFFHGISPREYLADPDLRATVDSDLVRLIDSDPQQQGDSPHVELVLEKKCRRGLGNGESDPVELYEIVNTRLRRW